MAGIAHGRVDTKIELETLIKVSSATQHAVGMAGGIDQR